MRRGILRTVKKTGRLLCHLSRKRIIQAGGCFRIKTAEMSVEKRSTKYSTNLAKQKSPVRSAKVSLK